MKNLSKVLITYLLLYFTSASIVELSIKMVKGFSIDLVSTTDCEEEDEGEEEERENKIIQVTYTYALNFIPHSFITWLIFSHITLPSSYQEVVSPPPEN